jgi:hypothetical protein
MEANIFKFCLWNSDKQRKVNWIVILKFGFCWIKPRNEDMQSYLFHILFQLSKWFVVLSFFRSHICRTKSTFIARCSTRSDNLELGAYRWHMLSHREDPRFQLCSPDPWRTSGLQIFALLNDKMTYFGYFENPEWASWVCSFELQLDNSCYRYIGGLTHPTLPNVVRPPMYGWQLLRSSNPRLQSQDAHSGSSKYPKFVILWFRMTKNCKPVDS